MNNLLQHVNLLASYFACCPFQTLLLSSSPFVLKFVLFIDVVLVASVKVRLNLVFGLPCLVIVLDVLVNFDVA